MPDFATTTKTTFADPRVGRLKHSSTEFGSDEVWGKRINLKRQAKPLARFEWFHGHRGVTEPLVLIFQQHPEQYSDGSGGEHRYEPSDDALELASRLLNEAERFVDLVCSYLWKPSRKNAINRAICEPEWFTESTWIDDIVDPLREGETTTVNNELRLAKYHDWATGTTGVSPFAVRPITDAIEDGEEHPFAGPSELAKLIGLTRAIVHFGPDIKKDGMSRDRKATLELVFNASFDSEHGLALLTDGTKILAIGDSSMSLYGPLRNS